MPTGEPYLLGHLCDLRGGQHIPGARESSQRLQM